MYRLDGWVRSGLCCGRIYWQHCRRIYWQHGRRINWHHGRRVYWHQGGSVYRLHGWDRVICTGNSNAVAITAARTLTSTLKIIICIVGSIHTASTNVTLKSISTGTVRCHEIVLRICVSKGCGTCLSI